jgi:hypothetical protein
VKLDIQFFSFFFKIKTRALGYLIFNIHKVIFLSCFQIQYLYIKHFFCYLTKDVQDINSIYFSMWPDLIVVYVEFRDV